MNSNLQELDNKLQPIYRALISACLKYTESKVDLIYILGTNVANQIFSNNTFFIKDKKIFKKNKINEFTDIEVSDEKQDTLLDQLDLFKDMYNLYDEYTGEYPREVRIKYDVKTGKFGMKLSYDTRLEESQVISDLDIYNEWMEACEKGNDGFDW